MASPSRMDTDPGNEPFKRKYSPDEILGYGAGDQYFESVPLPEESAFFRIRYYLDEDNEIDEVFNFHVQHRSGYVN